MEGQAEGKGSAVGGLGSAIQEAADWGWAEGWGWEVTDSGLAVAGLG